MVILYSMKAGGSWPEWGAYQNQLSCLQLQGQKGAGLFLALQCLAEQRPALCVGSGVCRGIQGTPVRAEGGGRRRNGSILWRRSPEWGRDCSGSCPPPVLFLKSQKSEAERKLPAAGGGEQMLSAHSRKLETRPPAAHQLSHRGPPLARTGSPVARVWGQEVAHSSCKGRKMQPRGQQL